MAVVLEDVIPTESDCGRHIAIEAANLNVSERDVQRITVSEVKAKHGEFHKITYDSFSGFKLID